MKKFIFLSFVCLILLAACDNNDETEELSCYYQTNFNNIMAKTTYNIDYHGTEINKIRLTYNYKHNDIIDGVGTGTDGTTNDTNDESEQIVGGIIGNAFDEIINNVTDVILDIAGIRQRHVIVQNTYGNLPGFAVQNTQDDENNNYTVSYVIDFNMMSTSEIDSINMSKDLNTLRNTLIQNGYTCE